MFRTKSLLMLLLLFLTFTLDGYAQMRKKERLANLISLQTSDILEKRHGMNFCGIGGENEKPSEKIKVLAIHFQLPRVLDKNASRKVIVDCVEEFVKQVNINQEIKQYLANVPFTAKNVDIAIFLYTPDMGDVFDPDISTVSSSKGIVTFYTEDPKKKLKPYKSITEESYEEAYALVQEQLKSAQQQTR